MTEEIGSHVATLPDVQRRRVSARTGWPGVCILPLDEIASLICNFCCGGGPSRWPSGKASASRAEDPGFESRLRRDFFGVELYQ